MENNCKLCGSKYDFRMVQMSELFGETVISLSGHVNQIDRNNVFKFCPLCGRELTKENYGGHQF